MPEQFAKKQKFILQKVVEASERRNMTTSVNRSGREREAGRRRGKKEHLHNSGGKTLAKSRALDSVISLTPSTG